MKEGNDVILQDVIPLLSGIHSVMANMKCCSVMITDPTSHHSLHPIDLFDNTLHAHNWPPHPQLIATPTTDRHTHNWPPHPQLTATPTTDRHTHNWPPHPQLTATPTTDRHTHNWPPHPQLTATPTTDRHTHNWPPHPQLTTTPTTDRHTHNWPPHPQLTATPTTDRHTHDWPPHPRLTATPTTDHPLSTWNNWCSPGRWQRSITNMEVNTIVMLSWCSRCWPGRGWPLLVSVSWYPVVVEWWHPNCSAMTLLGVPKALSRSSAVGRAITCSMFTLTHFIHERGFSETTFYSPNQHDAQIQFTFLLLYMQYVVFWYYDLWSV